MVEVLCILAALFFMLPNLGRNKPSIYLLSGIDSIDNMLFCLLGNPETPEAEATVRHVGRSDRRR